MDRNYESMLILKPDLTEKDKAEACKKITKRIESLEGKVQTSQVGAEKRNFYYPIRSRGAEKKKYTQGCYWLLQFTLRPDKLPSLKEIVKLEERILRNIIIKK